MTDKRLKSTYNNLIWTMFLVIITSLFPFIIRTTIIRYIGIEYAGVSSLFSSVLQIINIADLGIDSAMTYYLYKPMSERHRNNEEIGRIMNLLRRIYYSIGLIIIVFGVILTPFIPYLVQGKTYPEKLNVYYVYGVYILNSALPYFSGTYKNVLFTADQKNHVLKCIGGSTALVMYILQLTVLSIFHDFNIFTGLLLVNAILPGIIVNIVFKRYFPKIKIEGIPDTKFISKFRKQILAMAISKIRNISRNSFDSIIISMFIGLAMVAKYQNYYQVMVIPILIIDSLRGIVTPALGNGVAVEIPESNYGVLELYTFIQNFFITVATSCLLNLIQNFMVLWIGADYLLPTYIVIMLCVYFYILETSNVVVLMRETTGMWWKGRYVAIVEAVSNLMLNLILVKIYGIGGVIAATIITIGCINIPLELYYVFKYYFNKNMKEYIIQHIKYTLKSAVAIIGCYYICEMIPGIGIESFLAKAICTVIITTAIYCLLQIRNSKFKESIAIICKMLKISRL